MLPKEQSQVLVAKKFNVPVNSILSFDCRTNVEFNCLCLSVVIFRVSQYACRQRMAVCGGRDFEAPTYQTVANLSKCTNVYITHITRLTYIACYQLGFITISIHLFYIFPSFYPKIRYSNPLLLLVANHVKSHEKQHQPFLLQILSWANLCRRN